MQRPSPAARRFYRAFYQWTLLSSPAPGPPVRNHVSRRALSTSDALREEGVGEGQRTAAYRKHKYGSSRDDARNMHDRYNSKPGHPPQQRAWTPEPAQSSTERPFSSLTAWEEVTRYRTEDIIMLEVAVPLYRARALKSQFGPKAGELCRETGAKIELGDMTQRTGVPGDNRRLCSVLISGPPEAVRKVRSVFEIFQSNQRYANWMAKRATIPKIGHRVWHDMPVQSHIAKPSNTIQPWDYVLRSRSEDGGSGTIETIVQEKMWQMMLQNSYDAQKALERQSGATIEIGKHAFTGPTGDKEEDVGVLWGSSRSVLASGTLEQLEKAFRQIVATFKGYVPAPRPPAISLSEPSGQGESSSANQESVDDATEQTITTHVPVHPMLLGYIIGSAARTRNAIRRLSGVARFKKRSDELNASASIELNGTPKAVATAAHMVGQLIRTAYQHENSGLPPLAEAGIDGFLPTPNFFSKIRLREDLGVERTRQIEDYVIGKQGIKLQRVRLATLCRITWGQGSWTITGPMEGVVMAKRELQEMVERYCETDGVPLENLEEVEAGPAEGKQHAVTGTAGDETAMKLSNRHAVTETAGKESTVKLSNNLRAVLRPLTHPVVLITSRLIVAGHSEHVSAAGQGFAACRGVTVSSFTAVTMHPKPTISFNLKVPSRTWDAMASSNRLCVHILAATPAAAALTHAFTQPHLRPETPFETVGKLGGVAHFSANRQTRPPTIHHPQAVLARVQAGIIREKCVEVGDHVVVVAEVLHLSVEREEGVEVEDALRRMDESGVVGLSYARRGYRGIGAGIEIMKVPEGEEEVENLRGVDEEDGFGDETHLSEEDDADVFASEETHQDTSRDAISAHSAEDAEFDYFRTIQEEGGEEESPLIAEPKAKRSAAMEEEDDYDLGFGLPAEAEERPRGAVRMARHNGTGDAALQDVVTDVLDSARRSPRSVLSTLGANALKHHPSDLHKAQNRYIGQTKSYSTSAAGSFETETSSDRDVSEHVTDPSLLKQTVADFLGQSQEWVKPHRMRAVLNAKKAAGHASRQLERALAFGSLTEEESLRLEHTITTNDRRVAKSLALGAAEDLRRMLDEGKVHVRIAQWMEQAVERGMVVFVEEAKQARGMYDRGEIDEQQFSIVREGLEKGHGVLNTEALRLKGWFEDDEGEQMFDGSVGDGDVAGPEERG